MPDDAKKAERNPRVQAPPWVSGHAPPPTQSPWGVRPPVLLEDDSTRILWDKRLRQSIRENRLYRARKALAVMAWLIVALPLALIGLGSDTVMGVFVGAGHAVRGGLVGAGHVAGAYYTYRVAACAGLVLMIVFAVFWSWRKLWPQHHPLGVLIAAVGVAGVFVYAGLFCFGAPGSLYTLIGDVAADCVFLSPLLIFWGAGIIRNNPPDVVPYFPPEPVGRSHVRNANDTYDDSQPAFDFDIDQAMRGTGGSHDKRKFED
jgi:hypothetical protein